jgi:hypothetical protein
MNSRRRIGEEEEGMEKKENEEKKMNTRSER